MLASATLMGFLFTKDYDLARAFYEGKLGFQFLSQDQFALAMRAGAHMIRIVKGHDFVPTHATVLGWEVTDIEAMVHFRQGFRVPRTAFMLNRNKEMVPIIGFEPIYYRLI